MTHQFVLSFEDPSKRDSAFDKLSAITCEGENVFDLRKHLDASIHMGSQLRQPINQNTMIELIPGSGEFTRFYDLFYLLDQTKSGHHHPEGIFWFKTGHGMRHQRKVSILDVFPTILDFFEVDYAPSSQHPFRGSSLMSAWNGAADDQYYEQRSQARG